MKKTKKNVLPALILAASMPAFSAPDVTVDSVSDLLSTTQGGKLVKWIDNDSVAYFSALSGGTSLDSSFLAFQEVLDVAINTGLIDSTMLSIFENYPDLPTDPAGQVALSDLMGVENPTQEEFIQFTQEALNPLIFSLALGYDTTNTFIGASATKLFFAETDATNSTLSDIYSCDSEGFDRLLLPSVQTTLCTEIMSDIKIDKPTLSASHSVNKNGSIVVASENTAIQYHAIFNGISYTIDNTTGGNNGVSVIPGDSPIVVSSFGPNAEIFYLHDDGFAEKLTIVGFENKVRTVLNDNYLAVVSNWISGATNDNVDATVCQYVINSAYAGSHTSWSGDLGGTISCAEGTSKTLNIPIAYTTEDPDFVEGYWPMFSIGYNNEIAMAFSPGNNMPMATALYDIDTDEISFISNQKPDAIAQAYGQEFIDSIETALISNLPDHPLPPSDPVSAGLLANISQEEYLAAFNETITWTATQPNAYSEYLKTGQAPVNGLESDTDSAGQLLVLLLNPMYFYDENTLMTPNAKYTLTRPVNSGTLRARVALPNNEAPVGATATVQASDGTLTTKTTDANGVFAFANLPVGNYTVNISYNNHVASCSVAEVTSDSTNNMGIISMLAGDLDGNGTIANQDVWRFNARANYPTEDFDVNNDGAVNVSDKNMIMNNIGATQCQL